MYKRLLGLTLTAFTLVSVAKAQMDEHGHPVSFPAGYRAMLDATYVKVGDWEGKMDIYLPPTGKRPVPVVLRFHGGGWDHGNKVQSGGVYANNGMAVVNVEYRFTQVATAPAAVEDARCALRFVAAHATELNVDPSRIVVEGGSAGGYLALMVGLVGDDSRFDHNCMTGAVPHVAAIVDEFGPTDFTQASWDSIRHLQSGVKWLGTHADDEAFKAELSPITWVRTSSPPVLIVHGELDPTVPIAQSHLLYDALRAKGVKTSMVVISGGGHGGFSRPQLAEQNDNIDRFLHSSGILK